MIDECGLRNLAVKSLDPEDVARNTNSQSAIRNHVTCLRCRTRMIEKKRSYHKQRKWICPKCGAARMQAQKPRPARINRGA